MQSCGEQSLDFQGVTEVLDKYREAPPFSVTVPGHIFFLCIRSEQL